MEPEQEHLFKLYSGSGIHSLPELNPKINLIAHHPAKCNHAEQHKQHQINPQ